MALEESFSAQPLRSASTTHLGGVHHLAELADYIRVWFFGSCAPRDIFGALHTGAFWKLSDLWLFKGSPP